MTQQATSWERDVLKKVGAPVTSGNLRLLRTWQRWEGGHTHNKATYNWLNTTLGKQFPGINSVGVRAFPDYKTGVAYTADTILGGYPSVVRALRSGKPFHQKWRAPLISDFSKWVSGSRTARPDYGQRILGSTVTTGPLQVPKPRNLSSAGPKPPKNRNEIDLTMLAGVLDDGDEFWDLVQMAPLEMPELAGPAAKPKPAPPPSGEIDLKPGGGWGGSLAVAKKLSRLAIQDGLKVTSEKRDRQHTASGGVSDHWVGSKTSYAYDMAGSVEQMDKAAKRILDALGIPWDGSSSIVQNKNVNGYRIQVLYRTEVGGNHYDHIHIGVRKI